MGNLTFKNLIDTTEYRESNILKAKQLNDSFKQPEVATYALLKAVSNYFGNMDNGSGTEADIFEITGSELEGFLTTAFSGINNVSNASSSVKTTLDKSETYAKMKIESSSPNNYTSSIEFNDKLTIKSDTNLSFGIEITDPNYSNYSKISGSKSNNIGQLIYSSVKNGKSRNVNFDDVADLIKNGTLRISNNGSIIKVEKTNESIYSTLSNNEITIQTSSGQPYVNIGSSNGGHVLVRTSTNNNKFAYATLNTDIFSGGSEEGAEDQYYAYLQIQSEYQAGRRVYLGENGYNQSFVLNIKENENTWVSLFPTRLKFKDAVNGETDLTANDVVNLHGLHNRLNNNYLYYIEYIGTCTSGVNVKCNIRVSFYLWTTHTLTEKASSSLIVSSINEICSYSQFFYEYSTDSKELPCDGYVEYQQHPGETCPVTSLSVIENSHLAFDFIYNENMLSGCEVNTTHSGKITVKRIL